VRAEQFDARFNCRLVALGTLNSLAFLLRVRSKGCSEAHISMARKKLLVKIHFLPKSAVLQSSLYREG
jgi:hypothetical protein